MSASRNCLARQVITDRQGRVAACELLFRGGPDHSSAEVVNDEDATASVVAACERMSMPIVAAGVRAFVNVDAQWLLGNQVTKLPKHGVVLEVLETVQIDAQIERRCMMLKEQGYSLALDDFTSLSESHMHMLDLVDVVKVDITGLDAAALQKLVRQLRPWPVKLLAEKVETVSRARECLALGFDMFQGFFRGPPMVLTT